MHNPSRPMMTSALTLALLAAGLSPKVSAQANPVKNPGATPTAVLVELFTSEGCSSCPPADELLRQVNGQRTNGGQLIVGISEHVGYWNGLGWRDPFSADRYTERQNEYGAHFGLEGVYTPQMVVNGREQFVGSDRSALQAALTAESQRRQIPLRIDSAQIRKNDVVFTYTASDLPAKSALQLVAVLVDDADRSSVLRGENSGRKLTHVGVARGFVALGELHESARRSTTIPLPPSFLSDRGTGHHLVVFAQQGEGGPILGIDSKPI